jgi:hypothetical protein
MDHLRAIKLVFHRRIILENANAASVILRELVTKRVRSLMTKKDYLAHQRLYRILQVLYSDAHQQQARSIQDLLCQSYIHP